MASTTVSSFHVSLCSLFFMVFIFTLVLFHGACHGCGGAHDHGGHRRLGPHREHFTGGRMFSFFPRGRFRVPPSAPSNRHNSMLDSISGKDMASPWYYIYCAGSDIILINIYQLVLPCFIRVFCLYICFLYFFSVTIIWWEVFISIHLLPMMIVGYSHESQCIYQLQNTVPIVVYFYYIYIWNGPGFGFKFYQNYQSTLKKSQLQACNLMICMYIYIYIY